MKPTTEVLPRNELRTRMQELLAGERIDLPLRPEVATQAIAMCRRPDCDTRELSQLIHRDPSMAANLLKLANSPLYQPTVPIVSLQQAVTRLGLKVVREIALLISCQSALFRARGFTTDLQVLFRHSLAAAMFSQEVARIRRHNVEEAFLSGLFHDVGKAILIQKMVDLEDLSNVACAREDVLHVADELHGEAGARLAGAWDLGQRLAATIRNHHAPERAPEASPFVQIVRLADDLAHWAVGTRPVSEDAVRAHPMLGGLNLYPDDVDRLFRHREAVRQAIESL